MERHGASFKVTQKRSVSDEPRGVARAVQLPELVPDPPDRQVGSGIERPDWANPKNTYYRGGRAV